MKNTAIKEERRAERKKRRKEEKRTKIQKERRGYILRPRSKGRENWNSQKRTKRKKRKNSSQLTSKFSTWSPSSSSSSESARASVLLWNRRSESESWFEEGQKWFSRTNLRSYTENDFPISHGQIQHIFEIVYRIFYDAISRSTVILFVVLAKMCHSTQYALLQLIHKYCVLLGNLIRRTVDFTKSLKISSKL